MQGTGFACITTLIMVALTLNNNITSQAILSTKPNSLGGPPLMSLFLPKGKKVLLSMAKTQL